MDGYTICEDLDKGEHFNVKIHPICRHFLRRKINAPTMRRHGIFRTREEAFRAAVPIATRYGTTPVFSKNC
jgi:hypothetical protein